MRRLNVPLTPAFVTALDRGLKRLNQVSNRLGTACLYFGSLNAIKIIALMDPANSYPSLAMVPIFFTLTN